ncbi:MAG: aminotransferase class I/II-fold pyridoxal phosphate-dependent enzyme [Candidatus Mariimomonas ferrooxydans]
MRVGFMIADPGIIQEVNKVRLPFNLNSLSQIIAVEALKDRRLLRKYITSIISERKRLFREMKKIKNIELYKSDANFVLFKLQDSENIHKGLLKRGVLVRDMKGIVDGCLRVTVGTPKENTFFLNKLKQLL